MDHTPKVITMVLKVSRRQHRPLWWCMRPITWVRKGENHFSLISSKWRFFPFCNYQLGKVLFHYVYLFSLFYSIQSYLFWFAEFAEKLIDTTASRLARHILRNKEKMAWSFVLSGYRIWKLKVNKLMSDALLKDTQHAWVDLWMIAAEIRQT